MELCTRVRNTTTTLGISVGNANYAHFASLQENNPMSTTLFVSVIRHSRTKFSSRFSDIRSRENDTRLFGTPFLIYRSTLC